MISGRMMAEAYGYVSVVRKTHKIMLQILMAESAIWILNAYIYSWLKLRYLDLTYLDMLRKIRMMTSSGRMT